MREKLIKILRTPFYPNELADPAEQIAKHLWDNDVVPVVRCNDCKHFGTDGCAMDKYTFDVVEEGFCSYGERREK